ncbi:MAG: hypothetical protein QOH38_2020 [Thermoleophilaceae bacterium]|nr:hypothetical protein [Thermoleophilaceae bacterium]
MENTPGWLALLGVLVAAAVAFPIFTHDTWRALPPAALAVAIAVFLVRGRRRGPEAMSDTRRDRLAVSAFIGIAVVTAVAAIAVAVVDAIS